MNRSLTILALPIFVVAIGLVSPHSSRADDQAPQVYIGGNPIYPPYVIETEGDRVTVNGVLYFPPPRNPRPPELRTPSAEETATSDRRSQIANFALRMWVDLYDEGEGLSPTLATRSVADSLRAYPEVVSAKVVGNSGSVEVTWRGSRYPETLMLGAIRHFQYTGDRPNVLEVKASALRRALENGDVVFVDGGLKQSIRNGMDPAKRAEIDTAIARAKAGILESDLLTKQILSSLANPVPVESLRAKEESNEE